MGKVALVMPIAGRGSRFGSAGTPKPLLDLWGRPFFWWAAESVRRSTEIEEMVFVVLREHVNDFGIDREITNFYPSARIAVVEEVTSGAAETAKLGVDQLRHDGPLIVNDTDHAFVGEGMGELLEKLNRDVSAALLTFASDSPAYSYVRLGPDGAVLGTVEKEAVSNHAIAGAYMFANPVAFHTAYEGYREDCPYDEVYISGMYNRLIARGEAVLLHRLAHHLSFGTPSEMQALGNRPNRPWNDWL